MSVPVPSPAQAPTEAWSGAPARGVGVLALAALFVRFRLRSFRHALRFRRRGGFTLVVTVVGLMTSLAYVALFSQAFAIIVHNVDLTGQTAALAVVAGAIAFASLSARAASGEAARAGSPENEFLLARPVPLHALVVGRGLADAVTDPVGALFLLPVLIAASVVWHPGIVALPVAAATSILVQVAISMLAYTTQLALVRYVPARRRRGAWVVLRLLSALSLATLWMLGTWVMRSPAALARFLAGFAHIVERTPGALIAGPLAALRRGTTVGAVQALLALAAVALGAMALALLVAQRAGMRGWEEAGAVWADAVRTSRPATPRPPLTAARKDLRLITRDRAQLAALIALPGIFVGVQIFGAAGWRWSTATVARVACVAYSLSLYMATMGPLAHMQAERRAFWILRTVPVGLSRLLAAKARAWSVIVGGTAATVYGTLSLAIPDVGVLTRLVTGVLVVGGAIGVSFLAVAMATAGADLSDDQSSAVGPATIYAFILVGGLYNLVLVGNGTTQAAGLTLYAFAVLACWRGGVERGAICMDAEALRVRRVRSADAAFLIVVYAVGLHGLADATRLPGAAQFVSWCRLALLGGLTAGGLVYVARRSLPAPAHGWIASALIATALGLAAAAVVFVESPVDLLPAPPHVGIAAWPRYLAGRALAFACAEILFRGIGQRALAEELRQRPRGRFVAAAVSVAIGAAASLLAGPGQGLAPPFAAMVASQVAAAAAFAFTGRTSASWLVRMIAAV